MQFYARVTLSAFCALAAATLVGCGDSAPSAAGPSGGAAPEVTVARPLVREIVDWDDHVGRFEAVHRVDLRPRVTGYLVGVHFDDGELVEAGDLLFTIDPRPFEAALAEAQGRAAAAAARVENARTELERAAGLVDIQAVSTEEYEALEADLRSAEADLEAARAAVAAHELDVDFTRVTAPTAGRVSYRRVDVGNAVRADDTVLTTIVSVDPIHFVFQGSEAAYLRYKRQGGVRDEGGTPVRIRLQDEETYRWQGRVDFLDNSIDFGSGTIRGRAVVPNPDGFLTPGMFGHMQLQASERYSGLLLPDTAIATRGAQRIVYVVDGDGIVAAREVQLGPLHGGLRVIRSGITADDRVVVDGQQRARPGQAVDPLVSRIDAPDQGLPRIVAAEAASLAE